VNCSQSCTLWIRCLFTRTRLFSRNSQRPCCILICWRCPGSWSWYTPLSYGVTHLHPNQLIGSCERVPARRAMVSGTMCSDGSTSLPCRLVCGSRSFCRHYLLISSPIGSCFPVQTSGAKLYPCHCSRCWWPTWYCSWCASRACLR